MYGLERVKTLKKRTDSKSFGLPYNLALVRVEAEHVLLLLLGRDFHHGGAHFDQGWYSKVGHFETLSTGRRDGLVFDGFWRMNSVELGELKV